MTVLTRFVGLVGLLAVLGGFNHVLLGDRWWWTTAAAMCVVWLVLVATRRLASGWATTAGSVATFVATGLVAAPATMLWIVPTPSTVPAVFGSLRAAGRVIDVEVAPLDPPTSVIALLVLSFGLMVVIIDLGLGDGHRLALLGLVLLTGFAIPPMITGSIPAVVVLVVAGGSWLMTAWLVTAPTRSASMLAVTSLVAAVSLLAATALPAMTSIRTGQISWGAKSPDLFGSGVNTMIALGQNLRSGSDRIVLRSTTDADTVPYLRLATLSDFTGRTWHPGVADLPADTTGSGARSTVRLMRVTTIDLNSSRIPVPYLSTQIGGLVGVSWNDSDRTARLASGSMGDRNYTVRFVDRRWTRAQTADANSDAFVVNPAYLSLPDEIPAVIGEAARRRSAGAGSDFLRVEKLQNWLRSDFSYSTTAPVEEGYDGSGIDVIAEFLRVRKGYCVHFASTLAVMARSLGLPSRIVVGYSPGLASSTTAGRTTYVTRANQLHAWTEVWFKSLGWVGFDPTPGIGSATGMAQPAVTGADATGATPTPTASTSAPTAAQATRPGESDQQTGRAVADKRGAGVASTVLGWVRAALPWLAVVAVIATPWAIRSIRRRRRWRQGSSDVEPLWAEIVDTARDLGTEIPPSATARSTARLLDGPDASPAMTAVIDRVEVERYARPGVVDGGGEVRPAREVVSQLRHRATARQRIRAVVLPRSLFRRSR